MRDSLTVCVRPVEGIGNRRDVVFVKALALTEIMRHTASLEARYGKSLIGNVTWEVDLTGYPHRIRPLARHPSVVTVDGQISASAAYLSENNVLLKVSFVPRLRRNPAHLATGNEMKRFPCLDANGRPLEAVYDAIDDLVNRVKRQAVERARSPWDVLKENFASNAIG